jgi:hypothetical protein
MICIYLTNHDDKIHLNGKANKHLQSNETFKIITAFSGSDSRREEIDKASWKN